MQFSRILFLNLLLLSLSSSYAQEAAFDGTTPLTPEEEAQAEDYIHQGLADKQFFENCTAENRKENGEKFSDLCAGTQAFDPDKKFLGVNSQLLEAMIPAVSQAYTAIMALPIKGRGGNEGAGKIHTQNKNNPEEKGDDKDDWCKYIPVAGEAVNIAYTQILNSKTQENYGAAKPAAKQKASFEALARTHKDQRTASQMQMGVYGATGACYVSMLFGKTFVPTKQSRTSLIIKAGAATVMTTFYALKAKAHKERAKLLTELANGLPGAGECNPFTETTCFCNEETSFSHDPANFQKFCMPQELVARNKDNTAYVCADKNGKADPTCACDASNSCIDSTIKAGAIDFGIAPTMMRDPLASLRPLSKGFGSGDLNGSNARNRALTNKALKGFKSDGPINLNSDQKKLAKDFAKLGIPMSVAALMAKQSSGSAGSLPSGLAGLGGDDSDLAQKMGLSAYKAPLKNAFKKGGSEGKKSSTAMNPFGSFKKSSTNNGGIEIDGKYASKATLAAEIHNNTDVSIFRVISNRYQRTGWKQFPEAFVEEQQQ